MCFSTLQVLSATLLVVAVGTTVPAEASAPASQAPGGEVANDAVPSAWELLQQARSPQVYGELVRVRRHLHAHPELYFKEEETSRFIRGELDQLGIPYMYPVAQTGISALIGDGSPPIIALRADMDALPIEEPGDLVAGRMGFRSTVPDTAHMCGHDSHMSMLLGAARLLMRLVTNTTTKGTEKPQQLIGGLQGSVVLVFQPAEERLGGAKHVIEDGGLRGASAISGLHVWPSLPRGAIATRRGPIMAASNGFRAVITGQGGHGAMPHLSRDPVVAASAAVMALQTLVSRETSPTDGAVVTVSRFNTGAGAFNVIPDSVELAGTLRALSHAGVAHLRRRVEEVLNGTATTYGCSLSELEFGSVPYPPTVNDASMADLVLSVARELEVAAAAAGDDNNSINPSLPDDSTSGGCGPWCKAGWGNVSAVEVDAPSMAAEDFSFYGEQAASVLSWLGIGDPGLGTDVALHNQHFQVDESQMPLGAALHAAVALRYLQLHQPHKHEAARGAHQEL